MTLLRALTLYRLSFVAIIVASSALAASQATNALHQSIAAVEIAAALLVLYRPTRLVAAMLLAGVLTLAWLLHVREGIYPLHLLLYAITAVFLAVAERLRVQNV
jgi:hypothetical protein